MESIASDSARARASWSNARVLDFFAGSTTTNSVPCGTSLRYQKRLPSTQLGRTDAPNTSGVVFWAR